MSTSSVTLSLKQRVARFAPSGIVELLDRVAFDLRRGEPNGGQSRPVDRRHEMLDERRLARADIAGDDDEALALRQAEAEIRHRLLVRAAFEVEARVGCQLKGRRGQPEMIDVQDF